jgi:hypothetical protein
MAEFEQLALDPAVAPARVLSRHPLHQRGEDVVDWWSSGPVRIAHEAAVPAQDGARGDQPMAAQLRRQSPDEGGEDRPVRPVQAWSRVGAAEHGDLMPQHQQLDVLGGCRTSQQQDQPEHLLEDQIQQRAPRGAVVSDGGERPSVLCRRGGGVKLAAADPGIAGVGGSSRDKVGSVQDCRMGRAR